MSVFSRLISCGTWRKFLYKAIRPIRKACPQSVILKKALNDVSYHHEVSALSRCLQGHKSFRQLIDVIPEKHVMVFEHLDENLHHVLHERREKRLEELEVKRVAKVMLQGLVLMHEWGVAYTNVKAENIVIDFHEHGSFSKIKLIALGDAITTSPTADFAYGHWTTQASEALFGIPWTIKVDIWALGTLIMWAFDPPGIDEDDKTYATSIVMLQTAFFGPIPSSFLELSDQVTKELLDNLEELITTQGGRGKYTNTLLINMNKDTMRSLDRTIKINPRQRPSAKELLGDP